VTECEQQLAPFHRFRSVGPLERGESELIQACGLLIGEERERTIPGALGIEEPPIEVAAGDRVVGKLGEVAPGVLAVQCLERLDCQPVQVLERIADRQRRPLCSKDPTAGSDKGEFREQAAACELTG
jgi:hypothetical protein